MAAEDVQANVVLTANNTQYDQAMVQSAQSTDNLGRSVDSLGQKISNLTKAAGKSLIGIAAADVATITAATAAWASYEKQVSQLNAQAAVLTRTQDQQKKVMGDYTNSVKGLRAAYGTTTAEATRLTGVLAKVTEVRRTRDLKDLSKVFVDMSHATGESSEGLASSLTNLQKVMGTPINSKTTREYADQFTYLAAQTNTSAQGLIDFTAQLAPIGKSLGLRKTDVAGFATAFARAGQDGMAAANVFTKIAGDISKSMVTGSPEIAHYANLIGVTAQQFKEMESSEQVLQIFEALEKMGPRAATELNRMGLDGVRSMRQITAVLNEQGGMREALVQARAGVTSDAAGEGARAATKGLSDELGKLREEIKMTAEVMGEHFGPAAANFVGGMVKVAEITRELAEGPFGDLVALIMAVVAPLAGGAGALLLFAGALLKVAAAFAVVRSSAGYGVREGMRGGAGITRTPEGEYLARGGGELGKRGAQIAEGGSWFQRGQYNVGQAIGAGLTGGRAGIREGWMRGREWWSPDYQRPAGPRSMMSYMAGGMGRAMDWFMTPQFDQMRYADAAARTPYLQQVAPWSRAADRMRLGRQMGAVGLAEGQLGAVRQEELRVRRDPLLTDQARKDQLDQLKQVREETKVRLDAARGEERATRENIARSMDNARAQRIAANEAKDLGVGFDRLKRSTWELTKGMTGGALGAAGAVGKLGGQAFMRSGMAAPAAGMGIAMGAELAGVDSNAIMLGGMGMGLGPWGGAIGFGAGLAMDVKNANQDVITSLQGYRQQVEDSGFSFNTMTSIQEKSAKELEKFGEKVHEGESDFFIPSFGQLTDIPQMKNLITGWIPGMESSYEKAAKEKERVDTEVESRVAVATDIGKMFGRTLEGSTRFQRQELQTMMETQGAAAIAAAKLTPEDLARARRDTSEEGRREYRSMLNRVRLETTPTGGEERVLTTATGRAMATSYLGREAMKQQEDINLSFKAVRSTFQELRDHGMSYLEIMKSAESTQSLIGDEEDHQYKLQMALSEQAQQALEINMPLMTTGQRLKQQVGIFEAVAGTPVKTPEQLAQTEQITSATAGAFVDTAQQVKQMLLAQEQYERSRVRAEEDYNESRQYAMEDYNLSRDRAEEHYQRQRNRATADYYRNVRRAQFDFNLQRQRQEEDFHHQVNIMAKQAASSVYDIYNRVEVQRTSSASWLLSNAGDQLARMQEQAANLDELRKRGLSDTAIQQLKLTDPNNAQQLARFMTEITPQMIRQFNRVAGTERVKAAKEIVTDPSSLEWQEMRRGFRLARRRAGEDFERQMRISRQDFRRGLRQQDADFKTMMDEQAEDFEKGMARQERAYRKTMKRAAEDFADMGKEISGSLETLLTRGATELSGHAGKMARAALKSFQDLKTNLDPEAQAIMKMLADIFGFEYKAPKVPRGMMTQVGGAAEGKRGAISDIYRKEGGTIPGWTPGRDTTTVNVSGGEAIMRPEWARAMGEGAIDAMNHQAKYGGFASGGVFWPVPGQQTSTYRGHDGVDINRGSGSDDFGDPIRAFRGGKILYVGSGRGYGDAIFQRTAAGTVVYGHTSAQYVHAGQMVRGGQMIGLVGSTGNSSAPHLHFGIPGGTYAQAMALLQGAIISPMMLDAAARIDPGEVLKRFYPRSENSAYEMQGVHPLNPGMISQVINRYGRRRIRQLNNSLPEATAGGSIGREPTQNLNNQQLVRIGANRYGWGDQWQALRELVMHESGFNNTAQNPSSSAYGMFQFLDSTWDDYGGHKTSNPWLQTQYGLKYIKERYGNPTHAWRMWQSRSPHWYKDGSLFTSPNMIGVGEAGPEAVIPLNARGGEFLADAMSSVMGGRNVAQMRNGMTVYATRVDRSTNFTGPITVQANDPHELVSKLQARQRVMALSRPSLTGSAA